jgi:hypothetical protein
MCRENGIDASFLILSESVIRNGIRMVINPAVEVVTASLCLAYNFEL